MTRAFGKSLWCCGNNVNKRHARSCPLWLRTRNADCDKVSESGRMNRCTDQKVRKLGLQICNTVSRNYTKVSWSIRHVHDQCPNVMRGGKVLVLRVQSLSDRP